MSRDAQHLRFTSSLWLGRDETSDKRANFSDAVSPGTEWYTAGSAGCCDLWRGGAGGCIGAVDRVGDADSGEQSRCFSLLRL